MQQVRGGVVPRRTRASPLVNPRLDGFSGLQPAVKTPKVKDRAAHALGILDLEPSGGARQLSAIANLASALGVERRAVDDDQVRLPVASGPSGEDPQPIGLGLVRVADELRLHRRDLGVCLEGGPSGSARTLALVAHRRFEPHAVDPHPTLGSDLDGQVNREAECVVQAESVPTRNAARSC